MKNFRIEQGFIIKQGNSYTRAQNWNICTLSGRLKEVKKMKKEVR